MKRRERIYGGGYAVEHVTCEVVGKHINGHAVWAEVLDCGHHDRLFTLHKSKYVGYNFKAADLEYCEWNYSDNYHPCDCWISKNIHSA